MFKRQRTWVAPYQKVVNKEFETQRREILKRNKKFSKKDFNEWLFNATQAKKRMIAELFPLMVEIIRDLAPLAFDLADNPDTELMINQRITDYVSDRVDKLADHTQDESIRAIQTTLAEGIAAGDSLAQLRARINEVYDYATTVRSERIARTETIAASNEAANEAYAQSPAVQYKQWYAQPDACEFCREMDGKIIGVFDNYFDLGQTAPGDDGGELPINYEAVGHPPLHPNCECTILPVY